MCAKNTNKRRTATALKQIDISLSSSSGTHEQCLTFNGERHRTLWAIERVQLLAAQECKEGLNKSIEGLVSPSPAR